MWTNEELRTKCMASLIAVRKDSRMAERCEAMRFCNLEVLIESDRQGYKFSEHELHYKIGNGVMLVLEESIRIATEKCSNKSGKTIPECFLWHYRWGFEKRESDFGTEFAQKIKKYKPSSESKIPEWLMDGIYKIKEFIEYHPSSSYEYYYQTY